MAVNVKATRVALVLGSFLAGLVLFMGAIFLVTGLSPSPSAGGAAIGGPFHLVDENGRPFSNKDMDGKPYLVFFGYTHCPDICPTTLFEMTQLFRKLGPDANRVGALFITVDPARDTQAILKEYMASFDPHLLALTGDPKAIDQAIKDYRVYAKKIPEKDGDYSMDHTAIVYLMDKKGNFIAPFNMQRSVDAEAAELHQYM
jgi:protein SCO1/2